MPISDADLLQGDRVKDGNDIRKLLLAYFCKWGIPSFIGNPIATAVGAFFAFFEILLGFFFSRTIGLLGFVLTAIFKLIALFRKEGMQEFDKLTVESLSELLGVELGTDDLKPGIGPEAALENARRIGAKLHTRLIAEFTATGGGTPKSGEEAAQAFTGYVTRFAMMNSILSFLCDAVSLHHITQAREMGEEVAKNLSLGRLHRRALTPLIDNTISKPYDRELRARYRQDRLSDVQFIKAFQSGRLDEQTLRQELAYKGYPDHYIDELIKQLQERLTDAEVETLLRYTQRSRQTISPGSDSGQLTLNDIAPLDTAGAVSILVNQGWPEELAKQRIVANSLKRADGELAGYINEFHALAIDGFIDQDTAAARIRDLPLSPEELKWNLAKLALKFEYPKKRLTLAQVTKLFEEGVVDFDYWDRWVTAEGYSDEDYLNLTYQLLIDTKKYADKQAALQAAKDAKAAKAAKNHP